MPEQKWSTTSLLSRCPDCGAIASVRASESKRKQALWCTACHTEWVRTVTKWRKVDA